MNCIAGERLNLQINIWFCIVIYNDGYDNEFDDDDINSDDDVYYIWPVSKVASHKLNTARAVTFSVHSRFFLVINTVA